MRGDSTRVRLPSNVTVRLVVAEPAPAGLIRLLFNKWLWVLLAAAVLVAVELETSLVQSRVLAATARRLTYQVEPGPSPAVPYPGPGPYDLSLGYARMPEFLDRLQARGYRVASQARSSPLLLKLAGMGLYPTYREKTQTGLQVLGSLGQELYQSRYPARIYPSFESIPPLVVDSLLFIENREVLDAGNRYRNPSIEWDRFLKAMIDLGISKIHAGHPVSGGSTLATQMEKLRHSPEGRTLSPADKFRQIASASLRAYQDGEQTLEVRRRIIRDYINSIPLAAIPGYGEVRGLGDGLWAWYGADLGEVNRLLASAGTPPVLVSQAVAFRQVLSLLLALRRPTAYLVDHPADLDARVDGYLRLLAERRRIPAELRDAALGVRLQPRSRAPMLLQASFADRKAADAVRAELLDLLGVGSLYELDRLDLAVQASLDADITAKVAAQLQRLQDPDYAAAAGLVGARLLDGGDPSQLVYSFTLYERQDGANRLRVQADNYNQPLNINEGTKLELGSTAKLRTLVHYLEIVADLYHAYSSLEPDELARLEVAPEDRITRWAVDYLAREGDAGLPMMLEEAMLRTYSANPSERFFTGGGVHQFSNFDPDDNLRVLTVREAFQHSVNLPFIRLMREIVLYQMFRLPEVSPAVLASEEDPSRLDLLARFADREGSQFLAGFWRKYKDLPSSEALALAIQKIRPTQARLAVIFRSARPEASQQELAAFLDAHLPGGLPQSAAVGDLYRSYAPGRMSWNDRGYIARLHPLELFTLHYLHNHPRAGLRDLLGASVEARQEVYEWLYKVPSKAARDRRILTLLEVDAFEQIHEAWRRLGFPFRTVTPSYASAIGSSGDNPAALAELMGILVNGGMRYPTFRIEQLRFAGDTPLETHLLRAQTAPERVLAPEVASIARSELAGVVAQGTARRALGAVAAAGGAPLPVGGKTGTGDNRFQVFGRNHQLVDSKVLNRTATFVFFIGDRFFGTVTAFVPGPEAAGYRFTSALPVQVFRYLVPAVLPLLERAPQPEPAPDPNLQVARR